MAEKFMRIILEASLMAGIAAIAVMLLRIPMKKLPKRWSYLLWVVVFFRCLCPFSVESTVSIFNAVPEQSVLMDDLPQAPESDASGYDQPKIPENGSGADNYGHIPDTYYDPVYKDYSGNMAVSYPRENVFPAEKVLTEESSAEETKEEAAEPINWSGILLPVWAAGTAAMLLYAAVSYSILMRRIRFSVKAEDGVYETDRIPTAFSAGFFPPKIYLPAGLSQKERTLIIAHEQVHIRRLDFVAKPLAFAGLAIHWFNPLIWAAFVLMTRDMELSCDEAVLKILGAEEKKDYSRALVSVSMKRSGLAALPIAFAGTGIKERVKNVLSYKKPRIVATILAAVIVLTACAVLGTNAVRNSGSGDITDDEASLTLIENAFLEDDHMIEIENSSGDRIILLNSMDRYGHENAGLDSIVIGTDGESILINDIPGVDINIDPEYITRAVIQDLQIIHYDVYDSDGESGGLTFAAIDMELQMTDDYVLPPSDNIVDVDKKHGTVMCGGNNQRFGIYAEIEINKSVLGKDSCPGIMLTGFRSGDDRFSDVEIYVSDNLKITDMNFGRTIKEKRLQEEKNVFTVDEIPDNAEPFDISKGIEDNTAYFLTHPAENIKIYGGYFNNGDVHISPKIIIGHDGMADAFDQSWLTPRSILPRAAYRDFDGDGEEELAVSYYVGSGTGVSVEELVVYKMDESGHFVEHKLDPVDMLKENVSITVDNDTRNITYEINGSMVATEYESYMDDYYENGIKSENIYFGSNISYEFTGNAINVYTVPSAMSVYAGPEITARVNFSGGKFELSDFNFVTEEMEEEKNFRMREEEERAKRHEEESRQQEQGLKTSLANYFPDGLPALQYPVEDHAISMPYGNYALENGEAAVYKGISFPVPEGTPVYAAAGGKIINDEDKNNGYGQCIMIDHGNYLMTLYAHMSEILVQEGDEVKAGELIGYSGKTGYTYGAQLHFEVRVDGQHTDPMPFLTGEADLPAADGGAGDFLPLLVYNGMYYQIDEAITSEVLAKKYNDGSLEPIGETTSLEWGAELDRKKELSSNFIPVGSKVYKYEGGAKFYDTDGELISSLANDDLAIVVVYELNGERVVIFRPYDE